MKTPPAFRHVVVLRTDRIGDLLVSTPAIRNLRTALPNARITLVTSPLCADVLQGWNAIDSVEICGAGPGRATRAKIASRLRDARPDAVFAFTPQFSVYLLARRIGSPVRAGFGYHSRPLDLAAARVLLTHPVFSHVPETVERAHEVPHHADELLALLVALGIPASRCPMEVPIADADRAWAGQLLAARRASAAPIVLHLSHKWLDDGWSSNDLSALIDALICIDGRRELAITVGPADGRVWNALQMKLAETGVSRPVPVACPVRAEPTLASRRAGLNRLFVLESASFRRWAALVASSALVVSPDTGAIHLASATRRPVVGVYAEHRFHVFSRQWGPWMVPCRTLPKARGPAGVQAIAAAAESLLHEVAPGGFRA